MVQGKAMQGSTDLNKRLGFILNVLESHRWIANRGMARFALCFLKLHVSAEESGLEEGKLKGNNHGVNVGDITSELGKQVSRSSVTCLRPHRTQSSEFPELRTKVSIIGFMGSPLHERQKTNAVKK